MKIVIVKCIGSGMARDMQEMAKGKPKMASKRQKSFPQKMVRV